MTKDTAQPTAEVAQGEMRPWTDYSNGHSPCGGPVLRALINDLAGDHPGHVVVVGPHEHAVLTSLTDRAESVTVLVRSASDAEDLAASMPHIRVVAGSLDSFAQQPVDHVDLVVAADGLDRVMSYDSPPQSWADRVALLRRLGSDSTRLLLTIPHDVSALSLLDARPEADRLGDDDFDPLLSDPTRPGAASIGWQALGVPDDQAWLLLGPESAPRSAIRATAAAQAPAMLAEQAVVAATASRRPLLASPEEHLRRLAATRPYDAASAALTLLGAPARAHDGYLAAFGPQLVMVDRTAGGWAAVTCVSATEWPDTAAAPPLERDTAQPSETFSVVKTPAARTVPASITEARIEAGHTIADGAPVSQELFQRAATGDLAGFADLMHHVGRHAERMDVSKRAMLLLDDLYYQGPHLQSGFAGLAFSTPQATGSVLAVALFRLQDQLLVEHRRHPWPPWLLGEPLVRTWAEMAGVQLSEADLSLARQLADDLAELTRPRSRVPALREALADARESQRRLLEAQGQIFGLERTIGFRDKQLRTREDVIRNLRKKGGTALPTAVGGGRAGSAARLARRTVQVRSMDEFTAGMSRVVKRAQRGRRG